MVVSLWGACGDREISMAMRSVFKYLDSEYSHMLAGFHYPPKLQAHTNPASSQQRGMPRGRYAFQQLQACLLVMMLELCGHWEAGGEVLMPSS